MSDFLFTTTGVPPERMRAALARFGWTDATAVEVVRGRWGTLAVAGHAGAATVVRTNGAITVVIGEPVVSASPTRGVGPGLVGSPGRRQALHDAVLQSERRRCPDAGGASEEGAALPTLLDGGFALLVIDEEGITGSGMATIRIVTDRMGFVPVFAGRGWWGTHPDALAHAASIESDLDVASAADFLRHLSIVYPWTLYRGIEQLAPATVHTLVSVGRSAASNEGIGTNAYTYWVPEEGDPHPMRRQRGGADALRSAVNELRGAIEESTAAASRDLDRVGLLLSGGEDSRAVLGAVPEGVGVDGFSFADWESREVRVTRAAARAHEVSCRIGIRSPDQYANGFSATAALVGSMNLFVDLHAYGLHRTLRLSEQPVVLGGFSADALLKGYYASPKRRPESRMGWEGGPIRTDLLGVVRERRHHHREMVRKMRPGSVDEWTALWPFSMRRAGGHYDGNRRLFRTWEVFHSTGVLDVAARSPLGWKRNRKLFLRAVRPFLEQTRFLPHASSLRFPGLPRPVSLALALPLGVSRGGRSLMDERGRSHGPWPSMTRLADTLASRSREANGEARDSPLGEVFSGPTESIEREVAGWHVLRRLALFQLREVVQERPESFLPSHA